jgi:hypothetical protein
MLKLMPYNMWRSIMIRVAIIAAICGFMVYEPKAIEVMGSHENIVDGLLALLVALLSYPFIRSQLEW